MWERQFPNIRLRSVKPPADKHKNHIKKKLFSLIKKNIRQRFIYIIQIYLHHSFIIAMPPRFSILNQTRIMATIQISTMINNSSKIKLYVKWKGYNNSFSSWIDNSGWMSEWLDIFQNTNLDEKKWKLNYIYLLMQPKKI